MGEESFGLACTLWTVRVSVMLYSAALVRAFSLRSVQESGSDSVYRWSWLMSWICCVIHVVCAFHFIHRWDHDAALKHTAEMTARVVGIHWAGGLYINCLFLAYWGFDAVSQFLRTTSSSLMHVVAAFMMFNATVVFGPGWWTIPAVLLFGVLWLLRRNRRMSLLDAQ